MDGFNSAPHILKKFDSELSLIHDKIVAMGHLVEQQLSSALQAFTTNDVKLAIEVLKQDDLVDEYEAIIDAECISVIALYQPTGCDLDLLVSVIKVTNELESIAAKAEGIADITIRLNQKTVDLRG